MKRVLLYLLFIVMGLIGIKLDGTADLLFVTLIIMAFDIGDHIAKRKEEGSQ